MKEKDWCDTCKEPWASKKCNTCKYGYGKENNFVPMTNADKIRSMSDEELADIWVMEQLYQPCPSEEYQDHCEAKKDCRECWLEWLKAPVEEVDK